MMTRDEMITVLQADKDGKVIQCRHLYNDDEWADSLIPCWNFGNFEYRIKPEQPKPREWWLNVYAHWAVLHNSKAEADRCVTASCRLECIHVREVLP
jgi:hypothetical protein